MVNRLGVNRAGFSPKTIIYLFHTFTSSMVKYVLRLKYRTIYADKAVNNFYRNFFRLVAGDIRGPQVDKILGLCSLEPLHHLRSILSSRLDEILKKQIEMATLGHNELEIGSAAKDQQAFFNHMIAAKEKTLRIEPPSTIGGGRAKTAEYDGKWLDRWCRALAIG